MRPASPRYLMWTCWGVPDQGLMEPASPRYLKWAWWRPPHQGLLEPASPKYLVWAWWVLSHGGICFVIGETCLTKTLKVNLMDLRDFRLPPRSRWELLSSGFITQWLVVVYYRRFGTTYWSQLQTQESKAPLGFLTLEDRTDRWSRNFTKEFPPLTV